jgi:hypothetical protein
MVYLLGSTIMPKEGTYRLKKITRQEYLNYLKKLYNAGLVKIYVGNPENLDLEKGDIILVMRLKLRREEGDNFDYFIGVYDDEIPEKIEIKEIGGK